MVIVGVKLVKNLDRRWRWWTDGDGGSGSGSDGGGGRLMVMVARRYYIMFIFILFNG